MISQKGHGKGAAAATANDAALLLLVSLLGVPPLYTVLIGQAVLACTVGTTTDGEGRESEHGGSAVDRVAGLIANGEDADIVHIVLGADDLGVVIGTGDTSYHYEMKPHSPYRRKLAAKFGKPGKVERTHRGEIRNGVLPEITKFLGLGAEDAA